MPNFLVLQHTDAVRPGMLRDLWIEQGVNWKQVRLNHGHRLPTDVDSYDALVVLGGVMNVWQTDEHPWLLDEMELIRDWVVRRQKPYLGICLGHQLLAEALGGKTALAQQPEKGVLNASLTDDGRSDPMLAGLSKTLDCFHWHSAEVTELPDCAELLASSGACPNQFIRVGSHAYGFQAHIEVTEHTVGEWAEMESFANDVELKMGPNGIERLQEQVVAKLPSFRKTAEQISQRLLQLASDQKVAVVGE